MEKVERATERQPYGGSGFSPSWWGLALT